MEVTNIVALLKKSDAQQATKFASYIVRTANEKKGGSFKNPFMQKKTEQQMADLFLRVEAEGLVFDGVHITLQSTGVSYDYKAYRNKMLNVYPESKIDLALVYEGDDFSFKKDSGKVTYHHKLENPFEQSDDKIKGGYCVIKNKRGEFLTLLSSAEIAKHRKVAKQDFIWKAWFKEMCMKTIIKKACSVHFDDMYHKMNDMDNENNDVEKDVTETENERMQREIREALEIYQGDDVDAIREMCQDKLKNKEFTTEFFNNVKKQLGA